MMRNKIPLLLSLFMALSVSLTAAQVFILFDPACMDRLEYDMTRPDGKGDYLVYHVNIRSGEKLILEVGEESSREQNYLPEPYLYCNSGGLDQSLMRRINANIDEVYLVFPRNDKNFTISRVATAAYYAKNGNVLSYDSPKYSFRFDTSYGTIGENIAVNNPGAKVYFEGRLENDCTGAYLFRQLSPQSAYPLTDLVVAPEIGIIEERSGANASAALSNTIRLNKVNGRSADRYIQEVCGTEPGSQKAVIGAQQGVQTPPNYNAGTSRINPPGNLPSGAILPTGNVVNNNNTAIPTTGQPATGIMTDNTPTTGTPTTHTVASGETLYGISRKYSVDVADVKAWNNLSSNTIRRGQVLQVAPATNNTAPDLVSRGFVNNTGRATTLSGSTVPYDQSNTQRIMTDNQNLHIVKPGETVASVALEYGYTSKKFREINGLGSNDIVKVGQRLKTTDCNCATATAERAVVPNQVPSTATPNSYNSTGGRLAPNDLVARTPAASTNTNVINPGNSQVVVRNSGGLTTYSSPTVPVTTSRSAAVSDYNAIPNSYENTTARRTMSSLEESGSAPRAIGNATDFGNPVAPANTSSSSRPQAYGSPYPSPNTPISYDAVRTSKPDEYYQPAAKQRRIHVVASGESLYGISRRYGTTPEQLRRLNNLGPSDPIIEYQNLYIE